MRLKLLNLKDNIYIPKILNYIFKKLNRELSIESYRNYMPLRNFLNNY